MNQQNTIMQTYSTVKLLYKTSRKQIWLVKNIITKQLSIMKTQKNFQSTNKKSKNILHEAKYMQILQGYTGIPDLIWAGKENENNTMLLFAQRLGKSLKQLYTQQKDRFGLKEVCSLGIKLFEIIICIHGKGYAYGNLKLDSIQFGVGTKVNNIYINDMMDCVTFMRNAKYIKRSYTNNKIKIHQFMSYDIIQGYDARPKDDIYTILYIIIFLLKGQLPWTKDFKNIEQKHIFIQFDLNKNSKDIKQMTKDQTIIKFNKTNGQPFKNQIASIKVLNNLKNNIQSIKVEQITQGLDKQFKKMLEKCQQIQDQQKPDYQYFIRSLKKILCKHGHEYQCYLNGFSNQNALKKEDYKNLKIKIVNQQNILSKYYTPFEKYIDLK